MAVAHRSASAGNSVGSTASTTVQFVAPSVVTAGDIWICSATFRGGSTATISGVPAGFHLIGRANSGSASTNAVTVVYWYTALGSEPASSNFTTITISGSSKFLTIVNPFTGCDATTPVVGTAITGGGTTSASSSALPALATGQMAYGSGGSQGSSASPAVTDAGAHATQDGANFTTGGSAATNVSANTGFLAAATDATSQTWSTAGAGASTTTIVAFILQPPAAPSAPSAPTAVTAAYSGTTPFLNWTDSATGTAPVVYSVQRSFDNVTFHEIASGILAGTRNYTDTGGPQLGSASTFSPPIGTDGVTWSVGDAAANTKVAFQFDWPGSQAGSVDSVAYYNEKVGTPVDTLQWSIQADSSGSPSGTIIASGTESPSWTTPNQVTHSSISIGAAGLYWLVIERTGSVSATNFYKVGGVNSTPPLSGFKVNNGSTWSSQTGFNPDVSVQGGTPPTLIVGGANYWYRVRADNSVGSAASTSVLLPQFPAPAVRRAMQAVAQASNW